MPKKKMVLASLLILCILFSVNKTIVAYLFREPKENAYVRYYENLKTKYGDKCRIITAYGGSSLAYALSFGDAGANTRYYGKVLKEKFPAELFYDPWNHEFYDYLGSGPMAPTFNAITRKNKCVLLYGGCFEKEYKEYMDVSFVEQNQEHCIYQIHGIKNWQLFYRLKGMITP